MSSFRGGNVSPNVGLAIIVGAECVLLLALLSAILPRFADVYRNMGVQNAWWYALAFFLKRYSGWLWLLLLAGLTALVAWASQNDSDAMRRGLMLSCLLLGLCIPLTIVALFHPLAAVLEHMSTGS